MRLLEQLGAALEHMARGQCQWNEAMSKADFRDLRSSNEDGEASAVPAEYWRVTSRNSSELHELALEYTWAEMATATSSFTGARLLGSGASGAVYRGTLPEGTEVAVKVIHGPVHVGFEEEVRFLSRCRHPNVVMLLGFSAESPEDCQVSIVPGVTQFLSHRRRAKPAAPRRALVYELLSGGDLHVRLRRQGHTYFWRDRLRTAMDVARGLAHLHRHRPEIFHRDIKSQNILFGADGSARIADFGLACVPSSAEARQLATPSIAGTIGYADPLYAKTGVVSEASEVYSFGMVLMELLTGCPPAVLAPDGRSCTFLSDELRPWEDRAKHRVLQRLDARAQWPLTVATGLSTLALLCIHDDAGRRPAFLEVTTILQGLTESALALAEVEACQGASCASASSYAPASADACMQAATRQEPLNLGGGGNGYNACQAGGLAGAAMRAELPQPRLVPVPAPGQQPLAPAQATGPTAAVGQPPVRVFVQAIQATARPPEPRPAPQATTTTAAPIGGPT
eukprot:CAMPEP_0177214790 /NCGR_PEP_ID=MMETSP0367-20130122/33875_1 /TAXON_ID=447022 ORGANISM="Scrippsiella hangoei-like, Strain SHHI-4" /NCGR_SAMPLE_ID=MMETSP0367 /ASSEMBLY_ACC=CAM_ASM_000362 /LENGTH=510 /DNA_ID=CAMNT_0018664189 /DNA_START=64 /DNA_END=1593 /DNA_ORIENTATION=+